MLQKEGIDSEEILSYLEEQDQKSVTGGDDESLSNYPKTREHGVKIGIRRTSNTDYDSNKYLSEKEDIVEVQSDVEEKPAGEKPINSNFIEREAAINSPFHLNRELSAYFFDM